MEKKQLLRKNNAIALLLMQMENLKKDTRGEELYFRALEAIFSIFWKW